MPSFVSRSPSCGATIGIMTALPQARMTVDEYLAWAEGQPGRYELCDGTVFACRRKAPGTRR